jgi:hypothetical protein
VIEAGVRLIVWSEDATEVETAAGEEHPHLHSLLSAHRRHDAEASGEKGEQ